VQTQHVIDLAGHRPHLPPLQRAEHRPAGRGEPQEPEVLQEPVHVDRPGAGLESVVRDEQDQIVVAGPPEQPPQSLVE
jgi:hypothetical protein